MQPYLINSFRRNRGGAIFTKIPSNRPNAGLYQNDANPDERFHAAHFICNGNFTVHSIIRQTATRQGQDPLQETFTVGESVTVGNTNNSILSFVLTNSDSVEVYFATIASRPLTSISKRVVVPPPPPVPAPAPVQNGRRGAEVADFFANLTLQVERANTRPIRLRATKRNRGNQSLESFLIRFFESYNKERETIYVDDEEVQTDINNGAGRRRSLGDIYMICKYYYPQCTLREVLTLLYRTLPQHFGNAGGFRTSKCSQIRKRVWYLSPGQATGVYEDNQADEYGMIYRDVLAQL